MILSVNRGAFLAAFDAVGNAVPNRTPKPVLEYVRVEAYPDGVLLQATDLEVWISRRLDGAAVKEPGVALLNYSKVSQALKAAKVDADVEIESDDERTILRLGKAKWNFNAMPVGQFPSVPSEVVPQMFVVPTSYRTAIRRTVYATDEASTSYALAGVFHEYNKEGQFELAATDGRRFASTPVAVVSGEISKEEVPAVPAKLMKIVLSLSSDLEDTDTIGMAFDRNTGTYMFSGTTVTGRLVEGRIPRWRDYLPTEPVTAILRLKVGDLKLGVDAAKVTTGIESSAVKFSANGEFALYSASADGSSAVPVDVISGLPCDEIEVGVAPYMVVDALSPLDPKSEVVVKLRHGAGNKPVGIEFGTDDGSFMLVQPISLQPSS